MAIKKIKTVLGEKKQPKPTQEETTNWPKVSNLPHGGKRWESGPSTGQNISRENIDIIPRQPFTNKVKNKKRFDKKRKP